MVNTGDNLAGSTPSPGMLRGARAAARPARRLRAGQQRLLRAPAEEPAGYFWPDHKRVHGEQLPWRELRDGMRERGWLDLTNAAGG